jgi:aspartate aminotransferase
LGVSNNCRVINGRAEISDHFGFGLQRRALQSGLPIARTISAQLENASWIRRMFEIGIQLRKQRGAENVFDFSIGNPDVEPPDAVIAALRRVAAENRPRSHGYMPNAGFPDVRATVAKRLAERTGMPFTADDVLMTTGAAGAINIVLKSILDPGDEVILLNPYFPEYRFYVENHAGRVVAVETDANFQPDIPRIAAAITPRTKALILNSPNNPTGAVYSASVLRELNELIRDPILVISDEPYRPLVYDGLKPPETLALIPRAVLAWSYSKAMAIAGERIGFLAIPPHLAEAAALSNACTFAIRILGYINATALWQRVIAQAPDVTIDVSQFQAKRDLLCNALNGMGYDAPRPQGSFYVFPKTPIPDDLAFIRLLQEEGILAVPGAGFGRGGYMRLSLTIPQPDIQRALPGFERALRKVS